MSSHVQLSVPTPLQCTLFFAGESVTRTVYDYKEWQEVSSFTLFPYDFAYFHGLDGYHPWEHIEKHMSFLLNEWKKIDTDCQKLFSERKAKQALKPMKEGIALFFTLMFWIHHQPVQLHDWEQKVKEFPIKPVNLVERLTFIVERPTLYHSFIQLGELFHELEKHYAKSMIK